MTAVVSMRVSFNNVVALIIARDCYQAQSAFMNNAFDHLHPRQVVELSVIVGVAACTWSLLAGLAIEQNLE